MNAKPVIVGTAGHIDHGKTALVKALTGIDADRLEEEKRRGITIDIGFAHLELLSETNERLRLGFVDVPGHERFVRNMLAGIGGIDMVLLAISAEESIKPQTREHFEICRMLAIPRGITVLTKSDLVEAETLDVVRMEVEEFLRGSFLDASRSPIVAVSARTGAGLDELRRELARVASQAAAKDPTARFRLPVDRVFAMKGFGTVVTGTLIGGRVRKDAEVEAQPGGRRLRVRGVQVHGQAAEEARAGERTALNLANVATSDLQRGTVLTEPGTFETSTRFDVELSLLATAKALRDRARVHLHAFTAETIAEVVLLEGKLSGAAAATLSKGKRDGRAMQPGKVGFAQLRVESPMMLLPGDRFIIRQFSPVITIGGGVVLDAAPMPRRAAQSVAAMAFLETLRNAKPAEVMGARIARRGPNGLSIGEIVGETGWSDETIAALATELGKEIVRLQDRFVASQEFQRAQANLMGALQAFHKANPLVGGMGREELRERLRLQPATLEALLQVLALSKKVELEGEQVRAAGQTVVMKDDEAKARDTIERAFAGAGLKVPALKEVMATLPVDRARAQKIVTLLLREGVLAKLGDDLVFHRDALSGLRSALKAHRSKAAEVDVAAFKEIAGVSRKYAIPLLEYLDREHITRRVGDKRVIL